MSTFYCSDSFEMLGVRFFLIATSISFSQICARTPRSNQCFSLGPRSAISPGTSSFFTRAKQPAMLSRRSRPIMLCENSCTPLAQRQCHAISTLPRMLGCSCGNTASASQA